MFKVPEVPASKVEVTTVEFADILTNLRSNKRAGLDLLTRHHILTNRSGLVVLKTGVGEGWDSYWTYWSSYAEVLGIKTSRDVYKQYAAFPNYATPDQSLGYFTSDSGTGRPGFESLLMANTLYADMAIHLKNVDHDEPSVHMFEGFLAILGPALGFATTFIGDEKYSGHSITFSHRNAIEQTEWWWRAWNRYLGPRNSIQSVAGAMHKDDIVMAVTSSTPVENIGSCDHTDTTVNGWCGGCWKCVSTAYILWANGQSSCIEVTEAGLDKALAEQRKYYETGADQFRSLGLLDRVSRRTGRSLQQYKSAVFPSTV